MEEDTITNYDSFPWWGIYPPYEIPYPFDERIPYYPPYYPWYWPYTRYVTSNTSTKVEFEGALNKLVKQTKAEYIVNEMNKFIYKGDNNKILNLQKELLDLIVN